MSQNSSIKQMEIGIAMSQNSNLKQVELGIATSQNSSLDTLRSRSQNFETSDWQFDVWIVKNTK